MSRGARWGVGVVVVLFLMGAFAYVNREEIVLKLVGIAVKRRTPVGPYQEIAWSTGVDPQGRVPGDRPPNIVLILADDLGWNDLTWSGGGVAGGTVPTPNIDSIAAEGVSFTNGYAANGTCAPSRAALMAGRYGTRFGSTASRACRPSPNPHSPRPSLRSWRSLTMPWGIIWRAWSTC